MAIKALFVDVGGVLLTNGWDTALRKRLAAKYGLDWEEMNQRHEMIFDDVECGRCSFDEYLHHVVFFKPRSFTISQFKEDVYLASKPYPKALERIKALKHKHQAKLYLVSNESRDLAEYRYKKFRLWEFADSYIVSAFVGFCKPDLRIYQLALDLSQVDPKDVLYIDDRSQYFPASKSLGIRSACLKSEE